MNCRIMKRLSDTRFYHLLCICFPRIIIATKIIVIIIIVNYFATLKQYLHLVRKYAQIFIREHSTSRSKQFLLEENCELQGTDVHGKYPSTSLKQMEAIVFIILKIFCATCIREISPVIPQCYSRAYSVT